MRKFDELKKAAQDVVAGHVFVDIEAANMKEFELLARPPAILELLAIQAQLVEALKQALETIDDYLAYEHDGDPWKEDARTMGEMDINDYANDGRQAKAIGALAAAGAQP